MTENRSDNSRKFSQTPWGINQYLPNSAPLLELRNVTVLRGEKKDAVIIPRTALFRSPGGEWEVFVVKEEKARLVQVKLGLTNDREAEVTEGISAGDNVILAPATTLTDGARVKADDSG